MMLANVVASGYKVSIGDAAITALLGYFVVFVGLILLMIVVKIMSKIIDSKKPAPVAAAPAPAAAPVAAPVAAAAASAPAPGSAGEIKLYDTPDQDAAMVMAIVADKLGKPLNELRFISIKEVK